MIVFQVITILLLLSLMVFDNRRSKELILFLCLSCFFMSMDTLSIFGRYYFYILSVLTVLLLYIVRKVFPITNKVFMSPVTDKRKILVFLFVMFIMAVLNILNFSTGILIDPNFVVPVHFESFSSEDLLKVASVTLIVLSILYAKFEEDRNVHR